MPVRILRRVPGAIVRRRHCRFMVKMGFYAYCMGVSSYRFGG